MSSTEKTSVYSLPELKNTTDDALPNYLNSLGFKQTTYFTDVRLALGFSAVIIAGVLFGVDWKLGWEVTKPYTLPAVITYTILNGAYTYWLYMVEGDRVYIGERNGAKIEISSFAEKLSPIYKVKVKYTSSSKGSIKELELEAPFGSWFSEDGYFIARPFQHFLASNIPVVGEADLKNATGKLVPVTPQSNSSTTTSSKIENVNVNIENMGDILAALDQQKGGTRRRG